MSLNAAAIDTARGGRGAVCGRYSVILAVHRQSV